MRRRIGTAAAAFVIFIGSSIVSLAAETGGAPSSGEKGVAGSPSAEGIGSTSSTHNPNPTRRLARLEWKIGAELKWAAMPQRIIQRAKRTDLTTSLFARAESLSDGGKELAQPDPTGAAGFASAK